MRGKRVIAVLFFIVSGWLVSAQFTPYKPGERAEYRLHYGIINAGVATFELQNHQHEGREVWRSTITARTTGVADVLFRVRNVYRSYIDPANELPLISIRDVKEGSYERYNEVHFDRTSREDSTIVKSDLSGEHITEKGIHDILSCLYLFRKRYMPYAFTFQPGQVITINTWFTDEFYPIQLRYIGLEEVRTRVGRIKAHRFHPVTEVGRLFKTEEDISVWFSADRNYLPVLIRFDIFAGSFTVNLTGYEGLAYPLQIR